jgi:hypothetical protein
MRLIVAFIMLFLGSCAFAATTTYYQVELIIFAHPTDAAFSSETWPAQPALPDLTGATELSPFVQTTDSTTPPFYQYLPSTNFSMAREASLLNTTPGYEVLVHTVWVQPFPTNTKKAVPVHVYGGTAYDPNDEALLDQVSPLSDATLPIATSLPKDEEAVPLPFSVKTQWQVDGTIAITRPYLFQIDTNLVLTLPHSSVDAKQFVLQASYRTKANQIYYIDHPLFGVLIEITPIQSSVGVKS